MEDSDQPNWSHALEVLRKRWKLSLLIAAAVLGMAIVGSVLTKPVYAPSATVEITPPGTEAFSLQEYTTASTDSEYLETQSKNMQSDELALAVIRKLHLDQDPEMTRRSTLSRVIGPVISVLQSLQRGLNRHSETQSAGNDNDPAAEPLSAAESRALAVFEKQLSIKRDSSSRLVTVSYASHNAVTAARVTNTLVQTFIEHNFQSKHDAVVKSSQWLSKQLEDVQKKMDDSNRALAEFQKKSGIAEVDSGRSTVSEQLSDEGHQLTQAQTDRIQLESFLKGVQTGGTAALPQTETDPVVQQTTEKLTQARADLMQAMAVYGKNNPNVVKLQNQVDVLQDQLEKQRKAILAQLQTGYAAAKAREQLMKGNIKDTSQRMNDLAQYNTIKKEAEANAQLYNNLFAKVKEAGIMAEAKSANVQVVTPALVLDTPTKPNWMLNLAAGLGIGVFAGLLIPFVLERLDTTVHSAEDVRKFTGLGAPSLIPTIAGAGKTLHVAPGRSWSIRVLGATPELQPVDKFLLNRPRSPEAEAVRGVLTSVLLSWPDRRRPQVLGVVSSLPGEGKTTLAVNLGIALAAYGSTCIVDADLRKPAVSHTFDLNESTGLASVLTGVTPLETAIMETAVSRLSVLAAGSGGGHPSEMIASQAMREIVPRLRELFDFVVIDSPPLLPYADGRIIASLADGLILVGRSGRTPREAMRRSTELLSEANSAPILEVVLNAADVGSSGYGYGYNYEA
jgi:capsular exopolysaccharide synthesis family protein